MNNDYLLNAHWGSRQHSLEECSYLLKDFLECLASCQDTMQTWYDGRKTRKSALASGPLDKANTQTLSSLLMRGSNKTEGKNRTVIEHLGCHIGLWNGCKSLDDIFVNIICGSYKVVNIPFTPNLCQVTILGSSQPSFLDNGLCIMKAVVETWKPEWASFNSCDYQNAFRLHTDYSLKTGLITYLPHPREILRSLPKEIEIVDFADGLLLWLNVNQFSVDNASHISSLLSINNVLVNSGLLSSLP